MRRLHETYWVLQGARIDRLPRGDWMVTCAARASFHEHLFGALRWTLARALEAARENLQTRRSLEAR